LGIGFGIRLGFRFGNGFGLRLGLRFGIRLRIRSRGSLSRGSLVKTCVKSGSGMCRRAAAQADWLTYWELSWGLDVRVTRDEVGAGVEGALLRLTAPLLAVRRQVKSAFVAH